MPVETLTVIIYVLLIILLIVAIIIGIKLIGTIGKVDVLLDDVTTKVKTLDKFFNLVDYASDRVSMLTDVVANFLSTNIKKIFGGSKKTIEEDEINE